MKLAKKAFIISLTILALIFTVSAQTLRSEKDPRNIAPTVGTGGPVGGPTGLFTVYDGQTLRRGEFTFSIAYSNYDRDPGDVDIVEVPLSFQIGLSDHVELFFNTDGYRGVKVNSPANLSSFYLPNATFGNRAAIVLGPGGTTANVGVFRPAGNQFFSQFPFVGGNGGTFGFNCNSTQLGAADQAQCRQIFQNTFGSPFGALTLGQPQTGGAASLFPGIGSVYGSILPGVVLQTVTLGTGFNGIGRGQAAPSVFALAPSYLPDAPFIGRTYGESSFSTYTVGGKIRFTGPNNPVGLGIIPFYRFYGDNADDQSGFNQLQRGASPGGGGANIFSNRGDIGLIGFADARLRKWVNLSANVGYIYNSSVKADAFGTDAVLLDRGDELIAALGLDFPVNRYFQPILEIRSLQYVGGRTPNAFQNDPIDGLAGVRIFPARWLGFSFAYRYHANQQDRDYFKDDVNNSVTVIGNNANATLNTTFTGVPPGFRTSSDPHGFIGQFFIGRRNGRQAEILNQPAVINSVDVSDSIVKLPCTDGLVPREGETCPDDSTVSLTTNATDPENDVLTYNYTVSGGRIVGQGANVSWDLAGVQPGTYTVTVGVDDGCGVCSETKTETITVESCDCIPPLVECICPATITIVPPPAAVRPGENMVFTANVVGDSTGLRYNWDVDNGDIIDGQGTTRITVNTEGRSNTTVTATLNIEGFPNDCGCDGSITETGIIAEGIGPELVDEFESLPNNEVRARIDNLFIRLQNEPNSTGYVVNYGTARQVAARERLIRNHIRLRGYDASRIVFVNGGVESGIRTRLWIVPQGADPSEINE